ncbi:MAG: phosphoribosyl-AMP cyclohydrolase [Pseudomonadota bacterium]
MAPFPPPGDKHALEHGLAFTPRFDAEGMLPAIVSDAASGEVLMFAWMNARALALTIETRVAHFWSRSRAKLWKKGEESGNVLNVVELLTDCDQDVLWLRVRVEGAGVACHTGARSCFYRRVALGPMAGGEPRRVALVPTPAASAADASK